MISSVRGPVLSVGVTTAVVEVGGVGLLMTITPAHAATLRVGTEASIRTVLIVKEDDLALFGFADTEQLHVFDLLRGVTGVGPKSAMGVLSAMTPAQVAQAVNLEDDGAFRKVSGIGPKTAKLIIVSLAGKMVHTPTGAPAAARAVAGDARAQVVEALIGLGWNERSATKAADDAKDAVDPAKTGDMQALLRIALASLGPSQAMTREGAR
ncbi:Holliday junction branch migration protein RuvA [Salinibacterium sp. dk2585]|uniref:Holliday junction branch migration protein RuvA n=1 Tax=unclassified Salinibacterium TaxID=2632331 RepID=UPI0011C24EF9|nr:MULTISPECIES: Holliday junction branch migration protein RuvA [unclassified Salinibacterium]QEE61297.1 Holliday junction branch migration protein RuvA [Salinibacterium sp. dk2585]TXK53973.1 Holliday junction branch migration protein RuvA [Salinibacterium sp. dk5596]